MTELEIAELEFVDPRHGPRMVRLTQTGHWLIRVFGPVEGPWQQTQQEYASEPQAERAFARSAERLMIAGYQLGAHNPELIAAIAAAPDEIGNYLVYADWLLARGDPRGELIQLMIASEQQHNHAQLQHDLTRLQARERSRFERRSWSQLALTWRWGFVEGLTMPGWLKMRLASQYYVCRSWHEQQLVGLRNHPSGRFVRWLRDGEQDYAISFDDSVSPPRVLLREL